MTSPLLEEGLLQRIRAVFFNLQSTPLDALPALPAVAATPEPTPVFESPARDEMRERAPSPQHAPQPMSAPSPGTAARAPARSDAMPTDLSPQHAGDTSPVIGLAAGTVVLRVAPCNLTSCKQERILQRLLFPRVSRGLQV